MARNISRRKLFAGTLEAGLAAGATSTLASAQTRGQAPQGSTLPRAVGLPPVWGQDFLYQWSPPETVKRDLTPGTSHIRLSSPRLPNSEGTDYNAVFKSMRAGGWSACEGGSAEWVARKLTDSQASEIKAAAKANDVVFYGLHCTTVNNIGPDPAADRGQKHIIDTIHTAAQMECRLVLTHAGSMHPGPFTPHPLNWSREAWNRSVNALKRICKDTAGIDILIALETINCESINNPWAHLRMREDVGDPRISVGLDVTNMVHAGVVFRMTELINLCFDLLGDNIAYAHAKDVVWSDMLPGINWAMNGTGSMDYEQFLVRLSKLNHNPNLLIEFLSTPETYRQAQLNIRAIAEKVGVKIYGSMA